MSKSNASASATNTKDTGIGKVTRNIPKSTKTDAQLTDILVRARVRLLINKPFFGALAMRLQFRDATAWCPTAGTDGRYFYYNRDFLDALEEDEVLFLMGHEVLHCVYDHLDARRRGNRDPQLWNIANDFVINADLVDGRVGKKITLVDICYDTKYAGKFSEEIYDDLFRNAKKISGSMGTLDMHIDGEGGPGQPKPGEGDDGKLGPVEMTPEEREAARQDFQTAVINAAKAAGGAGNLPAGVRRLVEHLLDPKLDWRQLLPAHIQSVLKANYNWNRPNRKGMDAGFYFPSMDREQSVDVAIAIDTSGSISGEMLQDFMSEVYGIMTQYQEFKLTIWCFDTAVHAVAVFTPENVHELCEYELAGGGGTMFECNFEFMKEHGIEPKKFVMFTDGYPCGSWGDESYCDTLFIVHGTRGDRIPQAPYGVTVPYTREK